MASQIGYPSSQLFKRQARHLGTQLEVCIVHEKADQIDYLFEEAIIEFKRIERLFSTNESASSVHQINKQSGIKPVMVDQEIYQLIERSLKISYLTRGSFSIILGSLDNNKGGLKKVTQLVQRKFNSSSHLHTTSNVVLNQETKSVFLKTPGMRIGLDAIIKGYTVECIKRKLIESGANAGVINASGDLCTWGNSHLGQPWTVGIADPTNRMNIFSELELSNKSIATLGNPEKTVTMNGRKNPTFMNPHLQYPSKEILSVSIISDDAVLSDTLTSSVKTLGIKKGLEMINQMNDIDCIIIDEDHSIFTSNNILLK